MVAKLFAQSRHYQFWRARRILCLLFMEMLMKKLFVIGLAACLLLASTGCGKNGPSEPEPVIGEVISQASEEPEDLTSVLDRIYDSVTVEDLLDADDTALADLFHLELDWVEDYAARYSSGRYGVADVVIIKPVEGQSEAVIDALETRRNDRIAEFENYDIHDSLRIAKETEIFTRGDYVIMLMLADMTSAYDTIVAQIPG